MTTLVIGPYVLPNQLILAPMAGVTDRPFRQLCKKLKVGMTVSEMVGARSLLRGSKKTIRRAYHSNEDTPRAVQIVGSDPESMAQSAKINMDLGAQIIDINMGCPSKKVCNMLAGSALLRDETIVANILQATVKAVSIPVTLKIRTGWDKANINALTISKIAEETGIQSITIHGRTRDCLFKGNAEYDTIAQVKASVSIPVIANGDITTPEKAKFVLEYTKADGLMIGRAAQGRPWIFREIIHYLTTGELLPPPTMTEIKTLTMEHLENLYAFYGEYIGICMARKHVSWYSKGINNSAKFRETFNKLETIEEQKKAIESFFT
jgi:tRNA-dihydrouridine synthase B